MNALSRPRPLALLAMTFALLVGPFSQAQQSCAGAFSTLSADLSADGLRSEEFAERMVKLAESPSETYSDLQMFDLMNSMFGEAGERAATFLREEGNIGQSTQGLSTIERAGQTSDQIMKNVERLKKSVEISPGLRERLMRTMKMRGDKHVELLAARVRDGHAKADDILAQLKIERTLYLESRDQVAAHIDSLTALSKRIDSVSTQLTALSQRGDIPIKSQDSLKTLILPTLEKAATSAAFQLELARGALSNLGARIFHVGEAIGTIEQLKHNVLPVVAMSTGRALDLNAKVEPSVAPFELRRYLELKKQQALTKMSGVKDLYQRTSRGVKLAVVAGALVLNPVTYQVGTQLHEGYVEYKQETARQNSLAEIARKQQLEEAARTAFAQRQAMEALDGAPLTASERAEVEALASGLTNGSWSVRQKVVEQLSHFRSHEVTTLLLQRLNDSDSDVRATLNAQLANRPLYPIHIEALKPFVNDGSWVVRQTAISILARIDSKEVRDILISKLMDNDSDVQNTAKSLLNERIESLDASAIAPLTEVYSSSSWTVRVAAVKYLAEIQSSEVNVLLAKWLSSERDSDVLNEIERALNARR